MFENLKQTTALGPPAGAARVLFQDAAATAWRRGSRAVLFAAAAVAGLALGAQAGHATEAGHAAEAPISVTIDEGQLTLSAPGANLDSVLRAIGAEAGFKVTLRGDLAIPCPYTALTSVALDRALRRLAGGNSMIVVYEPSDDGSGPERIAELRLSAVAPPPEEADSALEPEIARAETDAEDEGWFVIADSPGGGWTRQLPKPAPVALRLD